MSHELVPFVDLAALHRDLESELADTFRQALHSSVFVGGAEVDAFERDFAAYCGTTHCVGVASGTDAVRFALMGAGVGPGDSVVTVSHTFIATVEAIRQAGAAVEFVDIDPRTYCMSPVALEEYLSACRTDPTTGRPLGKRSGKPLKAIVPVHLYGQMVDVDAIAALAQQYGLLVVEDACQAHGAEYRGADGAWRKAGSVGTAGAFSFYPAKNLGACGEGGAVTTNDDAVATRIRMLREHGQAQKFRHEVEGYNGRLDAIQAAVLRVKLRHLDSWNQQRRAAASRYTAALGAHPEVTLPFEPDHSRAAYHLYVVRHGNRDALAAHLRGEGISLGLHYPTPVHMQHCCRGWGYGAKSLPETERAAATVLSLPMFPSLTPAQQQRVADSVHAFEAIHARC